MDIISPYNDLQSSPTKPLETAEAALLQTGCPSWCSTNNLEQCRSSAFVQVIRIQRNAKNRPLATKSNRL